jgi:hypothetical protein
MSKRHYCCGIFVIVGDFPPLDNPKTFLTIFPEKFIPKNMLSLKLTPHLTEVIHVKLAHKRGIIGVFVVFWKHDIAEFRDVEDDK